MTRRGTSLVLYMSTPLLCLVDMKFCKNSRVGISFIIQWKWPNCTPRSTFYSTAAISNIAGYLDAILAQNENDPFLFLKTKNFKRSFSVLIASIFNGFRRWTQLFLKVELTSYHHFLKFELMIYPLTKILTKGLLSLNLF